MKVRFDVENNDFKRGYPTAEKPDGTLDISKGTKQEYQYPGMNWKNSNWGSYTRGNYFQLLPVSKRIVILHTCLGRPLL